MGRGRGHGGPLESAYETLRTGCRLREVRVRRLAHNRCASRPSRQASGKALDVAAVIHRASSAAATISSNMTTPFSVLRVVHAEHMSIARDESTVPPPCQRIFRDSPIETRAHGPVAKAQSSTQDEQEGSSWPRDHLGRASMSVSLSSPGANRGRKRRRHARTLVAGQARCLLPSDFAEAQRR